MIRRQHDIISTLLAAALRNDGCDVEQEGQATVDGFRLYADLVVRRRDRSTPIAVVEVKPKIVHLSRAKAAAEQVCTYADAFAWRGVRPAPIVAAGSLDYRLPRVIDGALFAVPEAVASGLAGLVDVLEMEDAA